MPVRLRTSEGPQALASRLRRRVVEIVLFAFSRARRQIQEWQRERKRKQRSSG